MDFCRTERLDDIAMARLHRLLINLRININYAPPPDYMPPLLLLCQYCKTENLPETLNILLNRNDVSVDFATRNGYNALMVLCKFYACESIIECVQLLIKHGINVDSKEKFGNRQNSLSLLCNNYKGKNLFDVALILLCHSTKLDYANKCAAILWDRGLKEESKKLVKIFRQLREGRNAVGV